MVVRELINVLSKFDPDKTVYAESATKNTPAGLAILDDDMTIEALIIVDEDDYATIGYTADGIAQPFNQLN